jgi:hypothetical protein
MLYSLFSILYFLFANPDSLPLFFVLCSLSAIVPSLFLRSLFSTPVLSIVYVAMVNALSRPIGSRPRSLARWLSPPPLPFPSLQSQIQTTSILQSGKL